MHLKRIFQSIIQNHITKCEKHCFFWFVQFHTVLEVYEPDAIIKVDTERWKKVFPRVIIKTSILPEGRTSLWENI